MHEIIISVEVTTSPPATAVTAPPPHLPPLRIPPLLLQDQSRLPYIRRRSDKRLARCGGLFNVAAMEDGEGVQRRTTTPAPPRDRLPLLPTSTITSSPPPLSSLSLDLALGLFDVTTSSAQGPAAPRLRSIGFLERERAASWFLHVLASSRCECRRASGRGCTTDTDGLACAMTSFYGVGVSHLGCGWLASRSDLLFIIDAGVTSSSGLPPSRTRGRVLPWTRGGSPPCQPPLCRPPCVVACGMLYTTSHRLLHIGLLRTAGRGLPHPHYRPRPPSSFPRMAREGMARDSGRVSDLQIW
jgi:hypothetical protein